MDRDTHLDQGDDVLLVEGRYELLVLRLITVLDVETWRTQS